MFFNPKDWIYRLWIQRLAFLCSGPQFPESTLWTTHLEMLGVHSTTKLIGFCVFSVKSVPHTLATSLTPSMVPAIQNIF